ncbi:MAG: hypothetical protein EXQ92_04240 [Alphaproteobacteria bacterium]|nr:hypothetical protein [Alphaproteobacteria bacterium]
MGIFGIFNIFRRPAPIRDAAALADFIDQNAAFVVQKGIYEYSRARAGHYAKVLFGESGFRDACDRSRWRAYPLGLAMVGELAEGILCAARPDDRPGQIDAIRALVLSVFDRHPVHTGLGAEMWSELRSELERCLALVGLHAPKWAKDVPEPYAEAYFNLMPIHEKLRGRDGMTVRNYLRVTMCNIHEELAKRTDAAAVAESLRRPTAVRPN